jgi:hypothetical protein
MLSYHLHRLGLHTWRRSVSPSWKAAGGCAYGYAWDERCHCGAWREAAYWGKSLQPFYTVLQKAQKARIADGRGHVA